MIITPNKHHKIISSYVVVQVGISSTLSGIKVMLHTATFMHYHLAMVHAC